MEKLATIVANGWRSVEKPLSTNMMSQTELQYIKLIHTLCHITFHSQVVINSAGKFVLDPSAFHVKVIQTFHFVDAIVSICSVVASIAMIEKLQLNPVFVVMVQLLSSPVSVCNILLNFIAIKNRVEIVQLLNSVFTLAENNKGKIQLQYITVLSGEPKNAEFF